MKKYKKVLLICISLFLLGFILFGYVGAKMIVEVNNEVYKTLKNNNQQIPTPGSIGINATTEYFYSQDSLKLQYYFCQTSIEKPRGTVILVHGIRSFKESFLRIAKLLNDSGYNAVAIDLRAHGQSEGKYCTYGYYEKQDIVKLVDKLSKNDRVGENIGIWAQSLGAAISLQAMGIDNRIKFGIIESTFSEFRNIVYDYAERTIGFRSELIFDYLIWWSEWVGDFNGEDVKPYLSCENITQPVLMVHGEKDQHINVAYGKKNFSHLAGSNNELILLKEATHTNVWNVGGDEYFKKVLNFIDQNK